MYSTALKIAPCVPTRSAGLSLLLMSISLHSSCIPRFVRLRLILVVRLEISVVETLALLLAFGGLRG
jgi:hypothetical protein